ncbi:MAG: protein-L-isoaspartate O-methyltransferase [Hyphomicrobiaceae bacterium]
MIDYTVLRRNMVESQVMPNDITDRRLLRAMGEVPRELFVGEAQQPVAYIDVALKIAKGRLMLAPMQVARLIQLARLEAGQTVLEIGCGTGYASAVMAQLAGTVVALESDPALARQARQTLASLGQGKVKVVEGPLEVGHAADGPYDAILISGSIPEVPDRIGRQLKDGGRLIAIIGETAPGRITVFTRLGNGLSARDHFDAPVAPLPGFERAPSFVF